jgi:hypothetical protein
MADEPMTARERLAAIIASQDEARGRPLTAREKLANLAAAMAADRDTPCPLCGVRDDEPCGYMVDGEPRACGL